MLEFNRHTLPFNTTLPYNRIYYVMKKELFFPFPPVSSEDLNRYFVEQTQGFPFQAETIRQDTFSPEGLEKAGVLSATDGEEQRRHLVHELRKVFPQMPHNYFAVRLLPQHNHMEDNIRKDTILIAEHTEGPYEDAAYEFAREAATLNFERMTGVPYYVHARLLYERKHRRRVEPRQESLSFLTVDTFQKKDPEIELKRHRELFYNYMRQFGSLDTNADSFPKQLEELSSQLQTALKDVGKLSKECCLKVGMNDSDNYDVLMCPDEGEPIVCLPRTMTKTLYIFFLRQKEGISLSQLQRAENMDQLTDIYNRIYTPGEHEKSPTEAARQFANEDTLRSFISMINTTFTKILVSDIAKEYQILRSDTRLHGRSLYSISLDRSLVDLGEFK